jgi:hypothetical protein
MREAPSNLEPDQFRTLGHDLVERIAEFLVRLPTLPVTPGESPEAVQALLPTGGLPERGAEPGDLLANTAEMLFAHSLFNGHPRFLGYVTSSRCPFVAVPLPCLSSAVWSGVVG